MTEFKCPRRVESSMLNLPEHDHWRADRTCSYCGSLHPDAFMLRVAAGEEVGPTDKSYKAYLGNRQKFYFQHLSREQKIEFIRLYNESVMKIGFPGHFYQSPYFMGPV